MKRVFFLIGGLVLLSSCIMDVEGTSIQKKYTSKRDGCREFSEKTLAAYSSYTDAYGQKLYLGGDMKSALTTMFSDCMNSRGWIVSTPRARASDGTKSKILSHSPSAGGALGAK